MHRTIAIIMAALSFAASAETTVTNEYLTVDQDGRLSHANIVATVADIASSAAKAELAATAAQAAAQSAAAATNALNEVARELADRELVIFRQGYVSAFDSTVFLSANCQCVITSVTPGAALSEDGSLVCTEIVYGLTENGAGIAPVIKYSDSLAKPKKDWGAAPAIDGPFAVSGAYTARDGTVFGYLYRVRVWTSVGDTGFFVVQINPGDALGNGYTFDITGGIKDGLTETITIDGLTLTITGGLITGVTEAER